MSNPSSLQSAKRRKAVSPSTGPSDGAPGGVAAVDRALSLLAAYRPGDRALTLAQLATRAALYKSTVLRLLASLEHAKLIVRLTDGADKGSYVLGVEVGRLHQIYAQTDSLEHLVMPVLNHLVQQTGESAAYHVLLGQAPYLTRLCQFRVDSPHAIRDHIRAGDTLPLDRGSGARVLQAFHAGAREVALRCAGAKALDYAVLEKIRRDGYFAAVGDRLGEVAGISAPVFWHHADDTLEIAAALTLTMPAHRMNHDYVRPVLEGAAQLSKAVGRTTAL